MEHSDWKDIPLQNWDRARTMRRDPSQAEKKLWRALRGGQLGVSFRRQHPIGPFIADFFCVEKRLVIEVDGPSHVQENADEYDLRRTKYFASKDISVIRFTNGNVLHDLDLVLQQIHEKLGSPADPPLAPPPAEGDQNTNGKAPMLTMHRGFFFQRREKKMCFNTSGVRCLCDQPKRGYRLQG